MSMHAPWALTKGKIRMWSKVFFLRLMLILCFLLYNYYVFLCKCPLIYEYNFEYVVSNPFRNSLISLNASKWCTLVSIHFQVCHYLFINRSPWILCSAPGNCDLFDTCMSHFRRVNKDQAVDLSHSQEESSGFQFGFGRVNHCGAVYVETPARL